MFEKRKENPQSEPEVGSSSRSGTEIRLPFYWNIAPNYDATLTPRLLADRGWQFGSQFRYLTRRADGERMSGSSTR